MLDEIHHCIIASLSLAACRMSKREAKRRKHAAALLGAAAPPTPPPDCPSHRLSLQVFGPYGKAYL